MTVAQLAADLTAWIAQREGFAVTSPALVASYLRDAMEYLEAQAEGREPPEALTAVDLVAIGRLQASNPWHAHGEVEGPRWAGRRLTRADLERGRIAATLVLVPYYGRGLGKIEVEVLRSAIGAAIGAAIGVEALPPRAPPQMTPKGDD